MTFFVFYNPRFIEHARRKEIFLAWKRVISNERVCILSTNVHREKIIFPLNSKTVASIKRSKPYYQNIIQYTTIRTFIPWHVSKLRKLGMAAVWRHVACHLNLNVCDRARDK